MFIGAMCACCALLNVVECSVRQLSQAEFGTFCDVFVASGLLNFLPTWMKQMEGLEGFGINSILWEEREFLDGGNYYYSPALGQIRLTMPPKTVGGW